VKHIVACTEGLDKSDLERNLLILVWHFASGIWYLASGVRVEGGAAEEEGKEEEEEGASSLNCADGDVLDLSAIFSFSRPCNSDAYLSGLKRIADQEPQDNA
jgi:hypothetical protein